MSERVPDSIEPVYGYRTWALRMYATYERALGSVSVNSAWGPGTNEAKCFQHDLPYHRAAKAACNCGLYAVFEARSIIPPPILIQIGGIAAGWGRVQIHRLGWRAEFAKVVALIYENSPMRRAIAHAYGVPVLDYVPTLEEVKQIEYRGART